LAQGLMALADLDLRAPPIERDQSKLHADGKRVQFHHESRKAVSMILDCSAAFFITNETKYLDCCVNVMRHVVSFDDWNGHEKFLDTAEMTLAVSVGYDWLYSFMTSSDRAVIQDGILRHALSFAPSIYGTAAGQEWVRKDNNGNMVNNCGMLAAALAIGDLHPDLLQTVVSGLVPSLSFPMGAYNPDGCWHEGPQYWSYGTQFAVLLISMLESALNTDLGLLERFPGFGHTALYRFHIVSPAGLSFNYGDNNQDYMSAEPHLTWLAQRFGLEKVEEHSRTLLDHRVEELLSKGPTKVKKHNKFDRALALHALWFPRSLKSASNKDKQLDRFFRGHSHIITLCSSWATSSALYVGLKGGSNGGSHGHLDLGTFVLDAGGQRWALDLGGDDYALPEYASKKEATSRRWSYLRTSNRGHNTVTVGSFSSGLGVHVSRARQSLGATAPLTHFLSSPDEALAALDLGPAYPSSGVSIARGVRLFNARSQVLLQDDFSSAAASGLPTGIIWRLFTRASVAVNPDGLSAVLSSPTDDKQMLIQLLLRGEGTSKARFSVSSAHPDAPSPIPPDEDGEEDVDEDEIDEEEDQDDEEVEVGAGGDVFSSMPLTEKERKKAEKKAAKREARHEQRAQERAQRRALKGKDPKGSGGKKKHKDKEEHPEAHFRRGVDRSKVKEDANEGVSLLVITALLLPGETLSLPVLFTPLFDVGTGVGAVEPSPLAPVTSWPGRTDLVED
jgi:hypothetical protein